MFWMCWYRQEPFWKKGSLWGETQLKHKSFSKTKELNLIRCFPNWFVQKNRKKAALKRKSRIIEVLQNRNINIRVLIHRNKSTNNSKGLSFPFFLIKTKKEVDSTFEVLLQENELKVVFKSHRRLILIGDLDLCSFLII